jgi:NitT/TauT family transport system ATP-binding protein
MMPPTLNLTLENVIQEFTRNKQVTRVLDPINLTLVGPSINMLMGRSGSGKSTLLRMLGGVRPPDVKTPTSGKIELTEAAGNGTRTHEILDQEDGAVTVFQRYSNRPDLTVRQNLMFPFTLGLWQRSALYKDREKLVKATLKEIGLEDKADLYPYELSGGQNQRVALGRALIVRPKILLMDEPFSALDPKLRIGMQQLLVDLWNAHPCLVVMVTHDPREAIALGDRIIVLGGKPTHIVMDRQMSGGDQRLLYPPNPEVEAEIFKLLD